MAQPAGALQRVGHVGPGEGTTAPLVRGFAPAGLSGLGHDNPPELFEHEVDLAASSLVHATIGRQAGRKDKRDGSDA